MPQVPAALDEVLNAHLTYLEAGTGTTETTVEKWAQMRNLGFDADHGMAVSAFGASEQYNFSRGGLALRFNVDASKGALAKLRAAYNFSATTNLPPVTTWRIRYQTLQSTSATNHFKFTGVLRHYGFDRPPSPADHATCNCVVQVCDANYVFDGTIPTESATRS